MFERSLITVREAFQIVAETRHAPYTPAMPRTHTIDPARSR